MEAVMVVVDRLSKYAVFMAVPSTCVANLVAIMFIANVVKIFGLPEDIVIPNLLADFGQPCSTS